MIRRISLYGGAGCGKSTFAAKLFHRMKTQGRDVELVSEWIKAWAYEGKKPQSFDQVFVLANQLHSEDLVLRHCYMLVTDSPVLLNIAYAKYYKFPQWQHLLEIGKAFEEKFPSMNIRIKRSVPFVAHGRYETHDEAKKFDDYLDEFCQEHLGKMTTVDLQVASSVAALNKKIEELPQSIKDPLTGIYHLKHSVVS